MKSFTYKGVYVMVFMLTGQYGVVAFSNTPAVRHWRGDYDFIRNRAMKVIDGVQRL